MTSAKKIEIKPKNFKSYQNVDVYLQDGMYKYTIGRDSDYDKIVELHKKVKLDYSDSFIVAFKNGERIPLNEARSQQKINEQKKEYIFYSFVAIAILAVTYWGFNFLKGVSLFNKVNSYYIYYDRIEGLNESSYVTVNGYKVGQVGEIKLLPAENYKLLVRIDITNEFAIPDSTIARIYSMDLMGTKGIELEFGNKQHILHLKVFDWTSRASLKTK